MPKKIDGKRCTDKEHRIWKNVHRQTGSGGKATRAVRGYRSKKKK